MAYQIIYSSEASTPMQADDLEEILGHARRSNAARAITGALVYAEGMFLQILEGDKAELQMLMDKIRRDVRHTAVVVLREGEIPTAIFGGWKMAYVGATAHQVAKWAGLGAAIDGAEDTDETSEQEQRTAQFAQDILALLAADATPKSELE